MTLEQANNLESGDIVSDTTNFNKQLRICFRRSERFFECAYLSPEYGWCNKKYNDFELVNKKII